jgi:hypothetical protein
MNLLLLNPDVSITFPQISIISHNIHTAGRTTTHVHITNHTRSFPPTFISFCVPAQPTTASALRKEEVKIGIFGIINVS